MKRNLIVGVGMLLVLAAAGTGAAATKDVIKVKVPFAFTVNDREMPAGDYDVYVADSNDLSAWVMRGAQGTSEEVFLTGEMNAAMPASATELVFDAVGDHHFLRKIWFEGETNGREIAVCKAEKALEMKGTPKSQHRVAAERSAPQSASHRG